MPASQAVSEAETRRQERKARAEAIADAQRDSLAKHLSKVDARLEQRALEKEASLRKRQHEKFDPTPGPSVLNVQMCGGGTYSFIEFRDEQCCETVMQFHGMVLSGKVIHPHLRWQIIE